MIAEAPGTILQMMYLRRRYKSFKPNNFYEIGCGKGVFSNLMLKDGIVGKAIDLNGRAVERSAVHNSRFIENANYTVEQADFLQQEEIRKYDMVFSCMVIEHLPDVTLIDFMNKAKSLLTEKGRIAFLVPASMKHWGIEDEIAGHIKRYEKEDVELLAEKLGMKVGHIAGLTYPISNWLFGISNRIVKKNESNKLNLSQKEKTIYTGSREVSFKTDFPKIFGLILNPFIMFPFHLLQVLNRKNKDSMVLYFELVR